jgi:hypothetical protein
MEKRKRKDGEVKFISEMLIRCKVTCKYNLEKIWKLICRDFIDEIFMFFRMRRAILSSLECEIEFECECGNKLLSGDEFIAHK